MPDLKQVLNDEIRRLARKELKLHIEPLTKQIAEQKRAIAELKRSIAVLEKNIPAAVEKNTQKNNDDEESKKLRLSASGIVKIRTKLGISQSKFAALLGVSGHTVSLWEIGKSFPRNNAKAAICSLRTIGKKELKRRLKMIADSEA